MLEEPPPNGFGDATWVRVEKFPAPNGFDEEADPKIPVEGCCPVEPGPPLSPT